MNDQKNISQLMYFAVFLSFCRGIRFPNNWTMTHYLLSYEHGYIKRGLIGSILRFFAEQWSYWSLATLAYLILFGSVTLLFWVSHKYLTNVLALVFFTSPGFVFYFHEVGYSEQIMIFMVVFLLCIARELSFRCLVIVSLICYGFTANVHEAAVVMIAPCFLLLSLVKAKSTKELLSVCGLFLVASIGLLCFALVLPKSDDLSNIISKSVRHHAMFEPRQDVFAIYQNSFLDYTNLLKEYWKLSEYKWLVLKSAFCFFPSTIMLIFSGLQLLQQAKFFSRLHLTLIAVIMILSCTSPVLLDILAYDFHRFHAISTMAVFLSLLTIISLLEIHVIVRKRTTYIAWMIVFLNLSSTNYFFDGYQPRMFPEYELPGTILKQWHDDQQIPKV